MIKETGQEEEVAMWKTKHRRRRKRNGGGGGGGGSGGGQVRGHVCDRDKTSSFQFE